MQLQYFQELCADTFHSSESRIAQPFEADAEDSKFAAEFIVQNRECCGFTILPSPIYAEIITLTDKRDGGVHLSVYFDHVVSMRKTCSCSVESLHFVENALYLANLQKKNEINGENGEIIRVFAGFNK